MIFSIIPDYNEIEKSFALAKKYNANFEYNDFCFPSVYEDLDEVNKRISFYLSGDRNIATDTMHGAFLSVDIAASDSVIAERSRELCEQSLKFAYRMGIKGVVFHTGLIGGLRLDYYLNNWLEKSVYFWTEICHKYPDQIIYIENSFEQEPDIFVRLMEQMTDVANFKLCLDYGHAILTSTPIEEWCEKLAPYIGHMHLNDNNLIDDLHLVPGTGKIDYGKWKKLMSDNNIDCSVLLEINGNDKTEAALEYMTALMGEKHE